MTSPTSSSRSNNRRPRINERSRPEIISIRRPAPEVHSETFDSGSAVSSDPKIAVLNQTFALTVLGDTTAVMKGKGNNIGFWKVATFKQWFSNQFVTDDNDAITAANYWLKHKDRRQYEGVTFAPGDAVCPANYYNLWCGFAVEPRAGDCSKFLHHLSNNVCRGDERIYDWTVGWFAQIIQQPEKKIGTSLCLRGRQGVGKTIVGEIVGSLLEPHYLLVADPRFITGKFNSHMASVIMLHADEAFWAGDHRNEGKIKDLITGKSQLIEYKGKDTIRIPTFIRLFVTGNQDWLVPAGLEERRFAVLDVGEDHIQDRDYFAAITAEMSHGGREALLHYLLNFDLSRVDLGSVPKTGALLEQKIASLAPDKAWWFDILSHGRLPFGSGLGTCPTKTLFESYLRHAQQQGARHRSIETALGILLNRLVPGLRRLQHRPYKIVTPRGEIITQQGALYQFPALDECRRVFEELLQQQVRWGRPNEWESERPLSAMQGS